MDDSFRHKPIIRWLLRLGQWGIIFLAIFFIYQRLNQQGQALANYTLELNFIPIFSGLLCLLSAFCFLPLSAKQLVTMAGYPITYTTAYYGYFASQLAKYLPGGVWVAPARAVTFSQVGVPIAVGGLTVLFELYILLLAGVLLFLPFSHFFIQDERLHFVRYFWGLTPLLLLALHPRFINFVLRFVGKNLNQFRYQTKGRSLLLVLVIDILFWLLVGLGLYWLILGVNSELSFGNWLPLSAAFSLAWVGGFISFLTPAGIGVREGLLTLLLSPLLPTPLPAFIAILARIWWTVAELISMGLSLLIRAKSPTIFPQVENNK